ncbi:MAG: ATP-binding protein, partial [Synechocystis sp.]|nr:ATP-binding protein [Synechocystis sp.]
NLLTQSFQTAFTSYETLFIGDRQGTIVASFPELNQVGESRLGSQQIEKLTAIAANPSRPLISDFHRDPADITPHVGVTFPILTNGPLDGFVYAALSLEQAANLIMPVGHQTTQEIILIDRHNQVLASCVPGLKPTTIYRPTEGGSIREVSPKTYHWFPDTAISPMLRWRKSYYYQILPIKNSPDWQLIVRLSATDQIDNLQSLSVKKLALLLLLTVGGLITSILISRRVASPLLKLAQFTTDIPNKLAQREVKPLILNSQVSEVAVLNNNFNEMLGTLKQQFQAIETARDSLEHRVGERTQELLIINQQLATEIQERERIERVLRESEERYDLAVSGTNDGLWDWDICQGKIYYSPVWKKILGYQPNAIPFNQPWLTKVHPDDRQEFQAAITDHLNGPEVVFSQTLRLENAAGDYVWVDVKGNCLRNQTGKAYRMVGTITDISDKKAVEAELRRAKENAESANRTKSEFLANISHEIRTPMNAILGFCELLQGSLKSPRSQSYLAAIGSSSKTLMALIDDILDISKIEAGKLVLHRDLVDLNAILAETKQIFLQKAQNKGIKLVTQLICPVPPVVYFDEVRLRQILFNIVGNAIKFTEKGQVSIQIIGHLEKYSDRTSSPGNPMQLTIQVVDTGIGIAPADQKRIFDVFTQSEGQSTRKYGGTGLGLTITKRLTQLLGGTLSLESQLGQGSIFTLHFLGVQRGEERNIVSAVAPQPDLSHFAPLRVLVVDDVESNRQLLQGFFEVTGHQVWAAASGPAAIALCQQQRFDLILMDLMMPEMDGQAAIAEIRKTDQNPTLPIVMVTASSQPLGHLLTPQGCQGILLKPVTQSGLATLLQELFPLAAAPDDGDSLPELMPVPMAPACPLLTPDQQQTLIDLLAQQETDVWERLRHTLISRELRRFGDRLNTWGKDYGWPDLSHYAQALLTALDNFDSNQLQTLMADFPQFRATLTANVQA